MTKHSFNLAHHIIMLTCIGVTLSGCYSSKMAKEIHPVHEEIHPVYEEIHTGEAAFFNGQYNEAAQIFGNIIKKELDPAVFNTARYNLAATQLMLSENSADTKKALKLLDQWRQKRNRPHRLEDPLLLVMALRKSVVIQEKTNKDRIKKRQEILDTVANRNKKIESLEKKIKILEQKILAIENIDQEIQKKRKAN